MSIYFFGESESLWGIGETVLLIFTFLIFGIWDPHFLKAFLKFQNSYLEILEDKMISVSL